MMTTTRTVRAMDRFSDRYKHKLLVLWVVKGTGRARVLWEQDGWTGTRSVSSLLKLHRLGAALADHKVHKHCKCCGRSVFVRVGKAVRMARAELRK